MDINRFAKDLDALARTCAGEARGETWEGMIAVCWVVKNRFLKPGWWTRERGDGIEDDTIEAACHDPKQFSCWNAHDPNSLIIQQLKFRDPDFQPCLAGST